MEVNGTTQNNDETNFSESQTLEPSDDQGSMMVSNESQNVSGDSAFSVSDSSSNVNNTLNSEQNVSNVLDESDSLDTDVVLIQSPKLLRNANITSTSSNAIGPTDTTNNDHISAISSPFDTNNDNNSAIGGSFLKHLFEINGPESRSINELLKEYPYLPYYSLFSLLTASTGREAIERMLEWMRHLQAEQVATTEGQIKSKEYEIEKQFLNAYKSDDDKTKLNARAGVSPSGGPSNVDTSNKCAKIVIIATVIVAVVAASVVTAGAAIAAGAGAFAIFCAGCVGATAAITILTAISYVATFAVNIFSTSPATRAMFKEYFALLNPVNAAAEFTVMVAELFTDDEATLQKIRLIATIVFAIIVAVLAIFAGMGVKYVADAMVTSIRAAVVIAGVVTGVAQIAQGVYTLLTLGKQENVAKRRLELDTAIAYCEKLQKDLDIIASEIDMIVELFTAAMDKIRAEYDRISRMIKETSDVKNMIARNIGA